jgi:hypothetical protein
VVPSPSKQMIRSRGSSSSRSRGRRKGATTFKAEIEAGPPPTQRNTTKYHTGPDHNSNIFKRTRRKIRYGAPHTSPPSRCWIIEDTDTDTGSHVMFARGGKGAFMADILCSALQCPVRIECPCMQFRLPPSTPKSKVRFWAASTE